VAQARQEAVLALVLLAGVSGVLGTSVARTLLDDPAVDGIVVPVWAFVGGAFYGIAGYFVLGALAWAAMRALGSFGSYRRSRHLVAFAAAPLALALVVLWPIGIAAFGGDLFRTGGSDSGTAGDLFFAAHAAFIGWSAGLLVLGVRAVEGWWWPRSLAAAALALAPVAAFVAIST
jgi:hypothetical protein